mmetsp:Transcript_28397/g.92741  ORF Transcript_28397/g.92741 Transcript_28397/m.92741 type:complete len:244 (+) Transcript_28397:140-871(+)
MAGGMWRAAVVCVCLAAAAGCVRGVHHAPSPGCPKRPASCELVVAEAEEDRFKSKTEACPFAGCVDVDTSVGESWFCAGLVDYTARVDLGTGEAPGRAEDAYARCAYDAYAAQLSKFNCRDVTYWTCDDCMEAYRWWVCASAFQKCAPENHPNGTMLRPCRSICNEVVRRCPTFLGFQCPDDSRDMWDYPGLGCPGEECLECNGLGLPAEKDDANPRSFSLSPAPRNHALAAALAALAAAALA